MSRLKIAIIGSGISGLTCGAYWFNGFHEDGVKSALRVCAALEELP